MKEKCKLKKNTSNAAGQFGFGMSATNDDYDCKMDEAYAQSMANFSASDATTSSTIDGLKNTNAQQVVTIAQQQQKLMMKQQQKFMEMMLNAGICKPTKVDGGAARVDGGAEKTRSNRGNPGKAVPPRKCGGCGKDRVTHRDEDC